MGNSAPQGQGRQVIFSDLVPDNNSYDETTGGAIAGPNSSVGTVSLADGFTSPRNLNLEQIDVGLTHLSGGNTATVSLWTNVDGVPGGLLGSWTVSGQPEFGTTGNTLTTIGNIHGITLTADTPYFLVVQASSPDTEDAWNFNSTGALADGVNSLTSQGAGFHPSGLGLLNAFDLIGTPEHSRDLLPSVGGRHCGSRFDDIGANTRGLASAGITDPSIPITIGHT